MTPSAPPRLLVYWHTLVVTFAVMAWTFDFRVIEFSPDLAANIRWVSVALCGATGVLALLRRPKGQLGWPVWLFLALISLTTPFSTDYQHSLVELSRVWCAAGLFLATMRAGDEEGSGLLRGVVWSSVFVIVATLAMLATGHGNVARYWSYGELHDRLAGFTWHPGLMGYFSSIVFGLALFRAFETSGWLRLAYLGLGAAAVGCLLLAESRAGLGAIALIAVGQAAAALRARGAAARGPASPHLVRLATAAFALALFIPVWLGVSGEIVTAATNNDRIVTIYERSNVWRGAMDQFAASPVFGNGFGVGIMFRDESASVFTNFAYAHSALPNYLAATGFLGALGVTLMLLAAAHRAVKALLSSGRTRAQEVAIVVVLTTIPFAVVEGALQGLYQTFVCFFIAYGVLIRSDALKVAAAPAMAQPTLRRRSA